MNLSTKIIEIRKENKMSQEEFAEFCNVSRQTISSWENAKSYPDIETVIKISNKFNISLDILLKEDKKMIEEIDKKIVNNKKLKITIIILILLLVAIFLFKVGNIYIKKSQEKRNTLRYKEITTNLKMLGFSKRDGIGFSKIIEDNITYQIYSKMPQALEEHITATTENKNGQLLIGDYNGKEIVVTYVDENITTVYCDKKGNLENKKQNKNNLEIYNKYQEETIKLVIRMIELFEEVYK